MSTINFKFPIKIQSQPLSTIINQTIVNNADVTGKADKATTLAGYGISDTYTKAETDAIISTKVAEIVANAPEDFDTLKEVAEWINNDLSGAAKMQADIASLNVAIETKSESTHNHDDRYYTQNEVNNLLLFKADGDHDHDGIYLTEHNPIDTELNEESENAVQNKVIVSALNEKAEKEHTHEQYLTEHNPIDVELNEESENAVQNKAIVSALNGKAEKEHTHEQYLTEHNPVDTELNEESENAIQNKVVFAALNEKVDISEFANKADIATTLAGYGITDAYTKDETDGAITDAIAKVVADAPEKFDTLKEVADWISTDVSGAAEMQEAISALQSGKADAEHGIHVPAIEDVDTNKFLRSDNTWQEITADTLNASVKGHTHEEYAAAEHNHNDLYALIEHTHEGFAAEDHTHAEYALAEHTHEGFAAEEHTHSEYALVDHTHEGFATEEHTHDEYALVDHTHNEYALTEHTHEGFAAEEHTHDEYIKALSVDGTTITYTKGDGSTDTIKTQDTTFSLPKQVGLTAGEYSCSAIGVNQIQVPKFIIDDYGRITHVEYEVITLVINPTLNNNPEPETEQDPDSAEQDNII